MKSRSSYFEALWTCLNIHTGDGMVKRTIYFTSMGQNNV